MPSQETAWKLPSTDDEQYMQFLSSLTLMGMGLKDSSAVLRRDVLWQLKKDNNPTEIGKGFFD